MKTFGINGDGIGHSVHQTFDGGYIIIGDTWTGCACTRDILLIKTDASGCEVWIKTLGDSRNDRGYSGQQTTDGGYIIAGFCDCFAAGWQDFRLIKTDASGDTLWTKTFGRDNSHYYCYDEAFSVQQTADRGYIITGSSQCNLYPASYPDCDLLLIKTDASGDTIWTKTFGGSGLEEYDVGKSVQQTTDGGYIVTGYTESYGAGSADVWLIRTDELGGTVWTKTFGGSSDDQGNSVQQTTDGGYIIAGNTSSYGAGENDVWLIKTDASGDTAWTRTFGGSEDDYGYSIQQTADGGYIIAGSTRSYGAGGRDVWLIKADASGDTTWTRTFGGGSVDEGHSVQQTTDGGYIITGSTSSYGAGDTDVWLIKTDENGNTLPLD